MFLSTNRLYLLDFLALEFDPDRFLDERLHKYLTPHPFIFLPFNAGPRICLGQQVSFTLRNLQIPKNSFKRFVSVAVCI